MKNFTFIYSFSHVSIITWRQYWVLKWAKWSKSRGFVKRFWKIFSLFLIGSNGKWNIFWVSIFLCKPHIWENYGSQVMVQNALLQSNCKVLRSSMYLEGINLYLRFLHRYIHWRKVATETITLWWVWSSLPSHAQTCLDLLECLWLVCEVWPG